MPTSEEIIQLGPLGALAGIWEGKAGTDVAPAEPDRRATATSSSASA